MARGEETLLAIGRASQRRGRAAGKLPRRGPRPQPPPPGPRMAPIGPHGNTLLRGVGTVAAGAPPGDGGPSFSRQKWGGEKTDLTLRSLTLHSRPGR